MIVVDGASANNLKNVTARFPLGVLTCVTGVSGSGKSSLVNETLVRAVEGYAGSTPTPEELYQVTSAQDLASLVERLEQAAGAVAPKASAPFFLPFAEYPPDLSRFRLKVTVVESNGKRATATR